jgi:hypothetical protein
MKSFIEPTKFKVFFTIIFSVMMEYFKIQNLPKSIECPPTIVDGLQMLYPCSQPPPVNIYELVLSFVVFLTIYYILACIISFILKNQLNKRKH